MSRFDFDMNMLSRYRAQLLGIAAIGIVIFHFSYDVSINIIRGHITGDESWIYPIILQYFNYVRSIGVEVFLFLSGMSMYYSMSRNSDIRRFYKKRLGRVLLPYLICGSIYWTLRDVVLRGEPWYRVPFDLSYASFLIEGQRMIWFIFMIMVMYLIYPAIHKVLTGPNRTRGFLWILAASIGIPVAYSFIAHEQFLLTNIATLRIPIFMVGCWCGKWVMDHKVIPGRIVVLIVAACLLLRIFTVHSISAIMARYVASLYAPGVLILLTGLFHWVRETNRFDRFFAWVGQYSLEIYLLHVCIRNLAKNMGLHTYDPMVYLGVVVLTVPLAIGLSKLTNWLLAGGLGRKKAA